jgi:hypothetical protein
MATCGIAALLADRPIKLARRACRYPSNESGPGPPTQSASKPAIGLITGLAKVGASGVVGHELDGAEPVGKMDHKDRGEEYDDHGRRSEGHEGAKENQQSADNLDRNRCPA